MSSDPAPNPASSSKYAEAYPSESAERERGTARAPKATDTRTKLAYGPLSLIILTIWVAYIAVLIWLLEHSTRRAKKYPQPRWSNRLTSAALTGFAQFHTAVTVMHLARLTVSVLYRDGSSRPHLTKLYWLNNRKWGGLVTAGLTLLKKLRLLPGHRFSITFTLFLITCLVALPTPYLLKRGYEERSIDVTNQITASADTFTVDVLPVLDTWMQLSAGEGAWVTGLPVTDIYNSSLFVQDTQARDDTAHVVVLSGSFAGRSAPALPGIQVQGDCNVYQGVIPDPQESFLHWCNIILPGTKYSQDTNIAGEANSSVNANMAWCTDHDSSNAEWMSTSSPVTAYIRLDATNSVQSGILAGIIKCTSSFSLGTADADGRYNTFRTFAPSLKSVVTELQHPLFAALYDLTMRFDVAKAVNGTDEFNSVVNMQRGNSILKMLGYTPTTTSGEYEQPTLEYVANQLRRGTMCMGAAIGVLAKSPNQIINNVTEYYTVTGRVRNPPYIWAAAGLLIAWLLMIVFCTIRMFRPTSSAALDIYFEKMVAANKRRLLGGVRKMGDAFWKDD